MTLKGQVLAVRDTGRTNMFDCPAVQRIAFEMGLYELVMFVEERPQDYFKFIATGDELLLEVG